MTPKPGHHNALAVFAISKGATREEMRRRFKTEFPEANPAFIDGWLKMEGR